MDNDKVFQFKEVVKAKKVQVKKLTYAERAKLRRAVVAFLASDKAPVVAGFPEGKTIQKRLQDFYPQAEGARYNTVKAWAEYTTYFINTEVPHIELRYSSSCELKFEFEFTEGCVNLTLVEQSWDTSFCEDDDEEEEDEDEDDDEEEDEIPTKSKSKTAKENIDD